jgi:hypothetical protein
MQHPLPNACGVAFDYRCAHGSILIRNHRSVQGRRLPCGEPTHYSLRETSTLAATRSVLSGVTYTRTLPHLPA